MSFFFDPDLSDSSFFEHDDLVHGTPSLYVTNITALLITIITTAMVLYHIEPVALFTLWERTLAECNLKTLLNCFACTQESVVLPSVVPFENKYLDKYLALVPTHLDKTTLENLVNNFVMEYTPNGNVVMFYDVARETFTYYADNSIPYRYLQVLARKYVCTFNCPSLYKHTIEPTGEDPTKTEPSTVAVPSTVAATSTVAVPSTVTATSTVAAPSAPVSKPSVYAKLKPYNAPTSEKPKEAVDNKPVTNRYTCSGKINNMSFLKKVPRTLVDKNYSMSFADFKKQRAALSSSVSSSSSGADFV